MHKSLRANRKLLILVFVFCTTVAFCTGAHATYSVAAQASSPTPTPTPSPDPEKDRLQREADLATLKKTKAVADKDAEQARMDELTARFPKPTTSPLEGKTTVEGAVIESQMVSYVSLARAADRIVERIKGNFNHGENLAVYNEQDVNLILNYKVATSQIDALVNFGYCKILTANVTNGICPTGAAKAPHIGAIPLAGVLPIAQSFLGAFVDFTALLRTNVEIKGQTFAIDEAPLVAEIFRSAKGLNPSFEPVLTKAEDIANYKSAHGFPQPGNFYYPYVFPPDINLDRGSELLQRLEDVHKLRGDAQEIIDAIQTDSDDIDKSTAKIKDLQTTINQTLPKQSADTVALVGTLIQANCRPLSSDVATIETEAPPNQSDDMVKLIAKVSAKCPKIDSDKLAQILGLGNTLTDTSKALAKAKTDLGDAQTKEKTAEGDLTTQLRNLQLNIKHSATPAGQPPPQPTADQIKEAATAAVAQLKQINTQFDNLVTSLLQSQPGTTNPLTNYIKVERLNAALSTDKTNKAYWLQVKVINAGGNNRVKSNLIVDIFTGGNRLSHSGGVIVEYHLFDVDGKSIDSGTVSDYTDYIKADKIHEMTGSKN
ncbi:MAG TPA: hypothetical protein VE961_19710 [Pyrinomonadaceae bacterium]|nr:hypothetical protein [Pyrinomonadaceae bacterium]